MEDDDLQNKYNTICDNVSSNIKKEFDSESVYNKKFLKTRIKSYGDEAADFYDKEIRKVGSNRTCLQVILLDSVLKRDENYYPQVFLKECKYIEERVIRHITNDLENFPDYDESEEEYFFFDTCSITLLIFSNKHSVVFLLFWLGKKVSLLDKSLHNR